MTTTEKAMVVTDTHWCLHEDCLDSIIPFTSQKDLIQHEKDAHGIYCKISKEPEPAQPMLSNVEKWKKADEERQAKKSEPEPGWV